MFLDHVPPAHKGPFLSALRAAQAAVRGSNISNSRTVTLYTEWTTFCTYLHLDHLIEDLNLYSVDILQVYGHQVHHSHYSYQENRRKADSVATE